MNGPHQLVHPADHLRIRDPVVGHDLSCDGEELIRLDAALLGRVQEDWLQLRLLWLRGDIAAGQGDLAAAEQAYLATRDGFVTLSNGYDAATVSLDLAILYLRQDRTADVQRLAEEMLPVFQAQDVHREALAALALFQEAARQDRLTLDQARQVAAFLREARNEPALTLRRGAGVSHPVEPREESIPPGLSRADLPGSCDNLPGI